MTLLAPLGIETAVVDNRRAINRIVSSQVMRGLASLARLNGGDTVQLLVFTGIWTANTEHLLGSNSRYSGLHDIPPDSQRRPIADEALSAQLNIPRDIVDRYVGPLIEAGLVERLPGGLVVPSAVINLPQMLDGGNEVYGWVVNLVAALRDVGFGFGDAR